jgi:hypothetical protein
MLSWKSNLLFSRASISIFVFVLGLQGQKSWSGSESLSEHLDSRLVFNRK